MKYTLELISILAIAAFIGILFLQNLAYQPGFEGKIWTGTDERASKLIESSGYQPWVSPLWKPSSEGMEILLFSLQAAMGSLVIGYFFGYYRGKSVRPKSP